MLKGGSRCGFSAPKFCISYNFCRSRLYVFNCAIPVELVNVSSVLTCAMIDPLLKHKLTPAAFVDEEWQSIARL
ncbi:Bifunctional chitinase/lysozyme [Trichinella spiralis]|uniref:Bifunctional chitinase/lysozyme n=1 Tax=Trichinella spiralis TaxID=6334 RepID=A0ABR3KTB4_TRISP